MERGVFECPICLEETIPTIVPCGHTLCEDCLKPIKSCPICRQKFPKNFKPIPAFELLNLLEFIKISKITEKKIQPREEDDPYNLLWENLISDEDLLYNIHLLGWNYPKLVQSVVIPKIKEGKSLIINSWNGSGKTGSFVIGTLCRVSGDTDSLQIISISHTKEIKDMHHQIFSEISRNSGLIVEKTVKYESDPNSCHILCGTVDSIKNYLRRKKPTLSSTIIIIDECDEIFRYEDNINTLKSIVKKIRNPQVLFYSATFTQRVKDIAEEISPDLEQEIVKPPDTINPKIKIFNVNLMEFRSKLELVFRLLSGIPFKFCIVFLNTKFDVQVLDSFLTEKGYKVGIFTGELEESQREYVINQAQLGHIKVLMSTDVLGRGFDCKHLDLVINYECPRDPANKNAPNFESFFHRCGRTGRDTRSGTAINIMDKKDSALYNQVFEKFKIPSKYSKIEEIIKNVENNSIDYETI
jgi:superfamily II DNA/RNA helicase